jgi:hypothetical protein
MNHSLSVEGKEVMDGCVGANPCVRPYGGQTHGSAPASVSRLTASIFFFRHRSYVYGMIELDWNCMS